MFNNINFKKHIIKNYKDDTELIKNINNLNKSYLLDLNKNNYDIIEDFVYNLSFFYIEDLKKDNNMNFYVEFSFLCDAVLNFQDQYFKEDKIKINPLICSYTFLNKSTIPLIITNLDFEKYKYKEFNDENELLLIFPNKFEHISFVGNLYHGFKNIFDVITGLPFVLKINIYNKQPNNIDYYNSSLNTNIKTINPYIDNNCNLYHTELILDTQNINKSFMDNILYENNIKFVNLTDIFLNYDKYIPITNHLKKNNLKLTLPLDFILHEFNYLFILKSQNIPLNQTEYFLSLTNKHGYIMYDVLDCIMNKTIKNTNIFYKEYIYNNFYSDFICDWFIKEINNYNKNLTFIDISQIPYLFRFCIFSFDKIFKFINKTYNLNKINIDIKNIQIIKKDTSQVDNYNNKTFLKAIIPLSKTKDYNCGDLIISNNIFNNIIMDNMEENNYILVYYLDLLYK